MSYGNILGNYVLVVLFEKIYCRVFDFKNEGDFDSYQPTFDRIFDLRKGR